MSVGRKVFVIVVRLNKGSLEFLCLKPNPEPERNTGYYVVTGSIEKDETKEDTVYREVLEEIGVLPIRVIDLSHKIKYVDRITKERFIEYCHAAEINQDVEALSEEHIDYMWTDAKNFINTIWWDEDRAVLKKMVDRISSKL